MESGRHLMATVINCPQKNRIPLFGSLEELERLALQ